MERDQNIASETLVLFISYYLTVSTLVAVSHCGGARSYVEAVPADVFPEGSDAMSTARRLRLGPLSKLESTKLTFAYPTGLKAELDRYASLPTQTYGKAVDAATLIPHMLEAFMAGDR